MLLTKCILKSVRKLWLVTIEIVRQMTWVDPDTPTLSYTRLYRPSMLNYLHEF